MAISDTANDDGMVPSTDQYRNESKVVVKGDVMRKLNTVERAAMVVFLRWLDESKAIADNLRQGFDSDPDDTVRLVESLVEGKRHNITDVAAWIISRYNVDLVKAFEMAGI